MSVRSGFVEVDGGRLYYELAGDGSPVALLHGFTLDARMWSGVADALARRYTVLAYDVRGFGRSSLPGSGAYSHREDLEALRLQLGLGPMHVVGHSIGGHQALEFALAYPEATRSVTGICASGLAGVPFPPEIQAAFGAMAEAAKTASVDAAKAIWARVGWFVSARQKPDVARALDEMLASYTGYHWLNRNPARPLEPAPAERLHELRLPSLFVVGELDLPYNHTVTDRLVAGIPGARRVVIRGAGHMAPMEDAAAVSDALLTFLDDIAE